MRHIHLDKASKVELWSGRRLCVETADGVAVYAMPKGAMSVFPKTTLTFGGLNKNTVQIHGTAAQIEKLAEAIMSQERPTEGWVSIK